jgi:hypothetical protein
MDKKSEIKKKRPVGKMIAYGVLTGICYALLFLNANFVMEYFSRGAWYAALPIGTAFLFSFVHGAFASNLWSVLGIEAIKKEMRPQPAKAKRVYRRRRIQPQPQIKA